MTRSNDQISEQELLQRYRKDGNKEWLGKILSRYIVVLTGVCLKYVPYQDEAQDIVQQVFIKALKTLEIQDIDNLGGWLYKVAKNECLDSLRKNYRQIHIEIQDQKLKFEATDPDEQLEQEQTLTLLSAAINQLKEEQRVCINLFYLQNKSYQEISDCTKFDIKQVKSNIQNGKRNLKIILEQSKLEK